MLIGATSDPKCSISWQKTEENPNPPGKYLRLGLLNTAKQWLVEKVSQKELNRSGILFPIPSLANCAGWPKCVDTLHCLQR